MKQLTPSSIRESVIQNAHERIAILRTVSKSIDASDIDLRLSTVILVAETLRDVEALVTEPLFQTRKQRLHAALPRIASCKDGRTLATLIKSFSADAANILPRVCPYDPDNPPW